MRSLESGLGENKKHVTQVLYMYIKFKKEIKSNHRDNGILCFPIKENISQLMVK